MASMVIILSLISSIFINSGMAAFSFDLSSTLTCPTEIPMSLRKADTI